MKKSEVKGDLLKMVESIHKRQRISKYNAAWQVKHIITAVVFQMYKEDEKKRESEYYRP